MGKNILKCLTQQLKTVGLMFSLQKAYVNARTLEEQQWKSNIVKKPGNIAKVIEPPPKTPEQL